MAEFKGLNLPDFNGATSTLGGGSGAVPAPNAGDQDKFLKGDATWAYPPDFIGDSGSGGVAGYVPAPAPGDAARYLRGDGTWQTIIMPVQGYTTIEKDGTPLTQRELVSFNGSSVAIVDNAGTLTTDISFAANLESLSTYNANGIITYTGSNTFAARALTAGVSGGIVITDGDGVAGNPVIEVGVVPIANGGTGATTAGAAATNLGLGTTDNVTFNDITSGGTLTATGNTTLNGSLTLSTFTPGSVLFVGTGGLVTEDNAHLFYDSNNDTLGLGATAFPEAILTGQRGLYIQGSGINATSDAILGLGTNRASLANGDGIGAINFYGASQSANHQLLGQWSCTAKGSTTNELGAQIALTLKPDAVVEGSSNTVLTLDAYGNGELTLNGNGTAFTFQGSTVTPVDSVFNFFGGTTSAYNTTNKQITYHEMRNTEGAAPFAASVNVGIDTANTIAQDKWFAGAINHAAIYNSGGTYTNADFVAAGSINAAELNSNQAITALVGNAGLIRNISTTGSITDAIANYASVDPSVTNLTGGMTNVYGFYMPDQSAISGIPASTNRWGVHIADNAQNYFAGKVSIGTTAVGAQLEITPSSANAISIGAYGTGTGDTGEIRFKELVASGTDYVGLKAPDAISATQTYILPSDAPTEDGQVLSSTTGGILSWSSALVTGVNNLIIGGDFSLNPWGRGTSFTTPGNGVYTADRFQLFYSGSGALSASQGTNTPSIAQASVYTTTSYKISTATAASSIGVNDYYGWGYKVEGYDYRAIAGQTITVSFWVYASVAGIYSLTCKNSASDQAYVTTFTVNTANTKQFVYMVIPGAPQTGTWNYTNGIGLQLFISLGCGSNFSTSSTNSWISGNYLGAATQVNAVSSTSNVFEVSLFKLELGSSPTTFINRRFGDEKALCQRYFEKSYLDGVNPGTSTNNGIQLNGWQNLLGTGSAVNISSYTFSTPKGGAPTVTTYAPTGQSGYVGQDDGSLVAPSTILVSQGGYVLEMINTSGRYSNNHHYTAAWEL